MIIGYIHSRFNNKYHNNMRKLSLHLFNLTLVALFSCVDKGEEEINSNIIVGEWNLTAVDYEGTTTSQFGDIEFTGTGTDLNMTVTFSTDPNEVLSEGDFTLEMEMTFAGQTETVSQPNQGFVGSGTWSVDGNVLSITTQGITQEAEIVELTTESLIVSAGLDQDLGQGSSASVSIKYEFEKL